MQRSVYLEGCALVVAFPSGEVLLLIELLELLNPSIRLGYGFHGVTSIGDRSIKV